VGNISDREPRSPTARALVAHRLPSRERMIVRRTCLPILLAWGCSAPGGALDADGERRDASAEEHDAERRPEIDAGPRSDASAPVLPIGRWARLTPTVLRPEGRSGTIDNRGWTRIVYDSDRELVILYEGYTGEEYTYTIYSNSLWTLDVRRAELTLERIGNWFDGPGDGYDTLPLPANASDPTPPDRHQTRTFDYAPDERALYLWSGLNRTLMTAPEHPLDLWRYDVSERRWAELSPAGMPLSHSGDQAWVYDARRRTFVLFGANEESFWGAADRVFFYSLDANAFTFVRPDPSPPPTTSHGFALDPVRDRVLLFGGGWDSGSNRLWAFDLATRTWSELTPASSPPARTAAGFAYDARHDVFLLAAGVRSQESPSSDPFGDTWVYHPDENRWEEVEDDPAEGPRGMIFGDLAYHEADDAFVAYSGSSEGELWLLRWESAP
jgi:hypothetical protein